MSEQESEVQEPTLPTPGQLLRNARQAKGLSLEQVANKINLRAHNIEAIESDKDDSNLSTTFTKGYLKLYAKFVDVKESDVLEAYERMNSVVKEPAKLQSFSRRVAKQTSDARLMMLTYFIIAIVIALSVLWWYQQSKETPVVQAPVSVPAVEQQEATSSEAITEQSDPIQSIEENIADSGEAVVEQFDELASSTDEATPSSGEVEALIGEAVDGLVSELPSLDGDNDLNDALPNDNESSTEDVIDDLVSNDLEITADEGEFDNFSTSVELVFEFSDNCWMNLVDATGEAIAYGVKASGRVMTVSGVPPFEVTLGAPHVVQITMAGDPVDMSRFPAGRTAKFELPLQE